MRLYEGTIEQFDDDISRNRIADQIRARFREYYHRNPVLPEYRSWENSLAVLNNSIRYARLQRNWIVIEYELPYSTRRIDAIVFGKDSSASDNVVIIELKQWSNDNVYECDNDGNITLDFMGKQEKPHPCLQVEGYHYDMLDFFHVFTDLPPIKLHSCVYCHNYSRSGADVLNQQKYQKFINRFPLFLKEDVGNLAGYLMERLSHDNGNEVFRRFITSKIRPSKKLLEHTGRMINEQQIFNLIDDQIAAFNAIMHKAKNLSKGSKKSVIIVKGGPGTGKSVIALEVMGELMRSGRVVYHATGSGAFTKTIRKIVGRRAENFFKFFYNFTKHGEDEVEVLICDEAHRIRGSSNDYGVPAKFRSRLPQIEDLIRPSKLSVYFIDDHQVVRPKEIGSVQLIKEAAINLGVLESQIFEFELKTQFRCSGSDAFLQWLDDTLDIQKSDFPYIDAKMEFKIFENPLALKGAIAEKNQLKLNSARLVAGFCWPWSKPNEDGSLVNDVKIGEFEMPWEHKTNYWKWATHKSGMDQVGTVYTAQGFEFDYIGVIFGPDLVYRKEKGGWICVPEESHDKMVKRKNPKLVEHLKSVYRVLLSRAHKGVYVYFMDEETKNYFKSRLLIKPKQETNSVETQILATDSAPKYPGRDILYDIPEKMKYVEYLPVYSLSVAAGNFGASASGLEDGWVKITRPIKLVPQMFVSKVIGHSMEPLIPHESYCIFRYGVTGSRVNKIVLVQHNDIADSETGGKYTVKKYTSEKKYNEAGEWSHESITLRPINPDYEPIEITNSEEGELMVLAEFVGVL